MAKKPIISLPIKIKYQDEIELTQIMLKVYSQIVKKMTPRNIDLLTICMLEDMNSNDFKLAVKDAGLNFYDDRQINSELTRLRKKGFIEKHDLAPRHRLNPNLEKLKELIVSKKIINLSLLFEKK